MKCLRYLFPQDARRDRAERRVVRREQSPVKIRELSVNEYGLQAVIIYLGAFKPYSGVYCILIMDRTKRTQKDDFIWVYDLTADGFSWTINARRLKPMTSPM